MWLGEEMIRNDEGFVKHTMEAIDVVFTTAGEKASAAVSVAMISTPVWKVWLQNISETAALIAPLLGCLFLGLQILLKILEISSRGK
jgi:hypothetical protein